MDQPERKAPGDVFDRTIRSMNGLPDVITTKATTVRSLSSVPNSGLNTSDLLLFRAA